MALMLPCYIVLHLEESPSEIAVEGVSKNRVLHSPSNISVKSV